MRMCDAVGICSSSDSIIRPALCNLLSQKQRKTNGQTDRQTDRREDGQLVRDVTGLIFRVVGDSVKRLSIYSVRPSLYLAVYRCI